jgi:adenylate cyclase
MSKTNDRVGTLPEETRKLAAIMFTDMVGYTELGQRNEAVSLALVEDQRKVIRPAIREHKGREVKTIGDGFLVEFSSALDAVRCAYQIQRAMRAVNATRPDEMWIRIRIGIHIGDVVESESGDISGDAVNVASRIEALAEAEGVCISRQVYDHIWNKFELNLQSDGLKTLKNVRIPIEVFRMQMPWSAEEKPVQELDRKRIVVMPFANMSPDPGDSYFADGITEEIISVISNVHELSVISRTSAMGYKGTTKKAREVGIELDVGSILEGSLRKAGNRIRITTQLIDANSDRHVWGESYDRHFDDVFGVQSEIAEKVAEILKVKLVSGEKAKLEKSPTADTEAYSLYLKGRQLLSEGTDSSLKEAHKLFTEVVKIDPAFARAYSAIGEVYSEFGVRSIVSYSSAIYEVKSAAKKALEVDRNLAEAHYLLAMAAWFEDLPSVDESEAVKAIELNPNLAEARTMLGIIKGTNGYPNQAVELLAKAYSLNPLDSRTIDILGRMYAYLGMEEEFSKFSSRSAGLAPLPTSLVKAEHYYIKGDYESASKELAWLEDHYPDDFRVISQRGRFAAIARNLEQAEQSIQKLEKNFAGGATLVRHVGIIRYYMGDIDAFFSAMFQSASEHVLEPFILRYSPLFEKARKDPRYREILAMANLDSDLKEAPPTYT